MVPETHTNLQPRTSLPDTSLASVQTPHDRECENRRYHIRYLNPKLAQHYAILLKDHTYRQEPRNLHPLLLIRITNLHHRNQFHSGRARGH